jgi:hypothetical protein
MKIDLIAILSLLVKIYNILSYILIWDFFNLAKKSSKKPLWGLWKTINLPFLSLTIFILHLENTIYPLSWINWFFFDISWIDIFSFSWEQFDTIHGFRAIQSIQKYLTHYSSSICGLSPYVQNRAHSLCHKVKSFEVKCFSIKCQK